MIKWPKQSECDDFYDNPRGRGGGHVSEDWYEREIVLLQLPFAMHMGATRITRISIHRKCAESLKRVFDAVAQEHLYEDDKNFDGSFNYRMMRNGRALSMHSYGCAIDIDAAHNPMGKRKTRFTPESTWVKAFEAEGWIWGGRWASPDAMHFQAARIR